MERRNDPDLARRRPGWLLPTAIGAVALLAVATGVLLAIVLRSADAPAGAATPTPSASSVAAATDVGSPSAEPAGTPTPLPTLPAEPIVPNLGIAAVVSDRLDLREGPSEEAAISVVLDAGRRVFVIGQPREVGDIRWYRVGILEDEGCADSCSGIGWVATPVAGERWIEAVGVDCPLSPIDLAALSLQPLEMLHCYGSDEIQVIGTVDTPCCAPPSPYRYQPGWLAGPHTPAFLRGGHGFGFRHDPSSQLEVPQRGDVVRVSGHFEDAAAPTCRMSVDPDWESGEPVQPVTSEDQALLVLNCRSTFVWTAYEVIGREELGPCCG